MAAHEFTCLLIESSRSKAYLQKLMAAGLAPAHVLLFRKEKRGAIPAKDEAPASMSMAVDMAFRKRKYMLYDTSLRSSSLAAPLEAAHPSYADFNPDESVFSTIEKHALPYTIVSAADINTSEMIDAVASLPYKYIVFGGGGILRRPLFETGKMFIHCHPGFLPDVRGSHCIEWSILTRGNCAVSAFIMNERIDGGEIILRREFPSPCKENSMVTPLYSAHIRSEVLVEVMKIFTVTGEFKTIGQGPKEGRTFYKMHPALSGLAMRKLEPCT